jgi:hypothetical protein
LDAAFWSNLFELAEPEPGATEEQLRELLELISRPLDHTEQDLVVSLGSVDPSKWVMPFRGLPESYLQLLRWSNGGTFGNGSRHIKFWHIPPGPRRMMVRYCFPEYAPLIVPFAGNPGTGDWYGFDTSCAPVEGEFPVVYIHHEIIRDYMVLAPTFLDLCRGSEDPEKLYWSWWLPRHKKG